LLPANRLGPEDSLVRAVARRGSTRRFATLHSACSPRHYLPTGRVDNVQEPQLGRLHPDRGDRAEAQIGWRAILLVSSEGALGSCKNA
jgi:hypothetical protein